MNVRRAVQTWWLAAAVWLHVSPVGAVLILVVVIILTLIALTAITAACSGKDFGMCGVAGLLQQ